MEKRIILKYMPYEALHILLKYKALHNFLVYVSQIYKDKDRDYNNFHTKQVPKNKKYSYICNSFIFSDTKEGCEFWNKVYKEYLQSIAIAPEIVREVWLGEKKTN